MDLKSSKSSAFHLLSARLAAESARADVAEQQVADLLAQTRVLHQDKLNLRTELSRTQQELQLWKIQLDLAQKEILRAQQVVGRVDQARVDAEERAYRSRQKVRRLLEERAVQVALDEGRNAGFQEGLELGRRRQPQLLQSDSRPPTRRRSSSVQRHLEQSAPVPTSAPAADNQPIAPTASTLLPTPHPGYVHFSATNSQAQNDTGPIPAPIQNGTETLPNISTIPPDNYIPTIHGDGSRIALPPPYEWKPRPISGQGARPRSDSQSTRPRADSQSTRRGSESRASVNSIRLRNDSRPTAPSPPPVPPVHEHSHPRPTSPRATTSIVASPQSSHLSQFDLISEPRSRPLNPRPNMTQPERIADEWRFHNPDVLTNQSESSSSTIQRPMSTGSVLSVPSNPPGRPTTTDSRTPRPASAMRKTREVVLPVPISNVFYDATANPNPSGDWLRSRFQNERTTSNATIPNIDVEPPSHSPTNSERTVVDPVLLTPDDANRPAPLPGTDDPSPVVAASSTFDIYARADKHQRHQSHDATMTDGEYISGVLPSDKNFPPGFIPLSPIPTLSNLSSIPESHPQSDINLHTNSRPPKSAPSLTGKPSSPGRIYASVPVPGPLNNGLPYPGFYPVPSDITVMRTDTSPAMRARASPAPLNRPFSIFSDV